jgi:homocitrate synthase
MKDPTRILSSFKGVIDSTLREGFQFSRANFTPEQQSRILYFLQKIKVDYVEVGNPSRPEIRQMIESLVQRRRADGPKILSHVRNYGDDIARAVACGVQGVNILCTVDTERLTGMGLTFDTYLERLSQNILTAKEHFLEVRVGVEDFFGQDKRKVNVVYALAEACGVDRVAIADTLGKTLPWEVATEIRDLRRRLSADIEVHFHNDLGHAVSNALAAVRAGANYVSASLLGIGERTGITALSSVLANLYVIDERVGRRYNLKWLTAAERYISKICGMEMPPHLITNPTNGFAHKAGIHLDAIVKYGPHKYELLSPQVVGNRRNMIIGTILSGKTDEADVQKLEERLGYCGK